MCERGPTSHWSPCVYVALLQAEALRGTHQLSLVSPRDDPG